MLKLKQSKKGSITDVVLVMVVMLVMSVTLLVVYNIYDNLNTRFQASSDLDSQGKAVSNEINDTFSGIIDNSMLFILIGLSLVAFFLAAMVRVHPLFFIFYLIILGVLIVISAAFSNIYEKAAQTGTLSSVASNLTFTTLIMQYLPIIIGVIGTILAIVMYKGWSDSQ